MSTPNRVLRSLILLCVLPIALVTGCSLTPRDIVADFDDSNQRLVEDVVARLDIESSVQAVVPDGASVALVSMERTENGDDRIQAVVEDIHVPRLLERGYRILERDADMVRRLSAEADSAGFTLVWYPERGWWSSAGAAVGATRGVGFSAANAGVESQRALGPRDELVRHQTSLDAADYLVSYRVLELGVLFGEEDRREKTIEREARARVHLRVQSTHDGAVLAAENLSASLSDSVDSRLVGKLAQFHYVPYGPGLPLSHSTGGWSGSRAVTVEQGLVGRQDADGGNETAKTILGILLTGVGAAAIIAIGS